VRLPAVGLQFVPQPSLPQVSVAARRALGRATPRPHPPRSLLPRRVHPARRSARACAPQPRPRLRPAPQERRRLLARRRTCRHRSGVARARESNAGRCLKPHRFRHPEHLPHGGYFRTNASHIKLDESTSGHASPKCNECNEVTPRLARVAKNVLLNGDFPRAIAILDRLAARGVRADEAGDHDGERHPSAASI